ncbi:AarF/UbiB family protein [Microbacterium sp. LX3-4]|uniref:AarF/UbiB family protein n=2 Tax=Microbacterium dauci TaxID=3048008 RepID=A0ABT6ZB40_9MICO|nr:AarF/UbiB family protein [Microbacterium sp. LX3-4]MDJ1113375.1 AarF/UbiB family protein [Microbacterium sp. LX3-4]
MRFAARTFVLAWWFELVLPRIGLGALAARGRPARLRRLAKRFHALAVDLGGLMIKVGQFLSSRLDVLPPEITKELEGLQDEVPAVPFAEISAHAETELGMPLARAYAAFGPQSLAAASLGQAHRATLTDADAADTGLRDVVVKVQRPGIAGIVDVDLRALRKVARWMMRIALVRHRVDAPALVEEFAASSFEEIDYLHEAAAAERFAADFAENPRVSAPRVVWERTTRRVLTLEDVSAIKINDLDALRAAGIDPAEVAQAFATVMFEQLFEHSYFHADPHPGNVFVTPHPDGTWALTFIDFGMMGEVPSRMRSGMRQAIIAAASRDGRGLVEAIRAVGALLPGADTVELERAVTAVFDRFGGMGFAELAQVDPREYREFAREFSELLRTMPFQLPEDFLLVIRTASLTSGMCSTLDPAFNVWDAVEPFAQRLLRDERGTIVEAAGRGAMSAAGLMMRLPRRADDLISLIEEGRLTAQVPSMDRRFRTLEALGRRAIAGTVFAGLLIAGALTRPDDTVLGTVLMAASAVPLLFAVFAGRR